MLNKQGAWSLGQTLSGWKKHCLLDRGSDIVNSEPKNVVRNEPRGVCRFEDKRLRKPVRWVLISLHVQIERNKSSIMHP